MEPKATFKQKMIVALAILAGATVFAIAFGLQFFACLDFYSVKP